MNEAKVEPSWQSENLFLTCIKPIELEGFLPILVPLLALVGDKREPNECIWR